MKTEVIDGLERISVLNSAGSTPELAEIAGDDPEEPCAALDELERLAASLPLDGKTAGAFLDLGAEIYSSGSRSGFRRGFRLAARLWQECAAGPGEGGEGHGKADIFRQ